MKWVEFMKMWKFAALAVAVSMVLAFMIPNTAAQDGLGDYTVEPVATGFSNPIDFIEVPDDSGRFLLMQQTGVIYVVENGVAQPEPFIDIQDRVLFPDGYTEQGLLGIALDPDFSENGYFYLNYSGYNPEGVTVISRFQLTDDGNLTGDPQSEEIIMRVEQPYGNHNGGMLAFGPDGYFYISFGDGGSANDPLGSGQNTQTMLGSILRIDVHSAFPYTVPADNPFITGTEGLPEIWAYGLRNAWRFSFDIATGDLYIADVGQNEYEEINFQPADSTGGENYGWNVYEATHSFSGRDINGTVMPVAEYNHSEGCSVSGGYVYRGETMPELDGYYIYGDYCSGRVWWLTRNDAGEWENGLLFDTDMRITGFAQDRSGEIYILDIRGGVYQIVPE